MNDRGLSGDVNTISGLAAILLWSSTVALARSISEQLGPITGAACVYGVGGLLSMGRLLWRGSLGERVRGLSSRYLLGCGALFLAYTLLLFLAVGLATDRTQVLEVGLGVRFF